MKTQTSSGGAYGPDDYFITASAQREDGYREHSRTETERLNANFGYQFSPDAETRFYINAGRWRAEIPGEVTKRATLTNPQAANPTFVLQNQQRNIDTIRLANKDEPAFRRDHRGAGHKTTWAVARSCGARAANGPSCSVAATP
ncbi:hypothetical protein [Bradyrhizobium diazoefficiens]|uniref:hypothetical protein n=1 Tax=Bradyrhizobium diazoefficiens TaxID=1355477 RepID=UPI001FEEA157|nr:hypothetical protein [Bradyrhizobium diazoefficiens]